MKLERNGIELERRPAGAAITLDDGDVRWFSLVALPAMIAAEPSETSPGDSPSNPMPS